MLEISTFEFIKMQTFVQEEKSLNLRPKMSLFSIFRLKFGKMLSYLKSAISNLPNANFRVKVKILKFGKKNA